MDIIDKEPSCRAAYNLAKQHMPEAILNHCIRVYLYAASTSASDQTLLFISCILHDIGSTDICHGPQRFEVEGADRAVKVMEERTGLFTQTDYHQVWVAIALHTSPGIAERITPMANTLRRAVLTDFHAGGPINETVEKQYPRLDIEKVLGDAVAGQCMSQPQTKAPPASWPGLLYRAQLADPDWKGVNKAF